MIFISKIYDENGWLNWDYLYSQNKFIMTITGPRGTGKTYGLLKYVLEHDIKFIYMRRLKTQLDQCASGEENNPFKSVNTDIATDCRPDKLSGSVLFVTGEDDEMKCVGYGVALSTAATIRGSDYSDVNCVIFDEYIAMDNERPIKNEAGAFYNFLETVNRNRELKGKDPIKVFMLGNANRLMNPYFLEWHFMRTALRMIAGKQMVWRSPDNSRIMILLCDSPVSERKRETALYRNASEDFISMAIDNAFATDPTNIMPKPIRDCRHVVSIGTMGVYQLKSTGEHYISSTVSKNNFFEDTEINIKFFRYRYSLLKTIYLSGFMLFESYETEMIFRAYFDI